MRITHDKAECLTVQADAYGEDAEGELLAAPEKSEAVEREPGSIGRVLNERGQRRQKRQKAP